MLDIQNLGTGSPKKERRENERETFINEEIKETSLSWRASVSRLKRTTEWSTKTRPTASSPLSSIKMNKYIQLFTTLDNRQSRNIIPDRRGNSARAELKFTSFLSGDTSPTIVEGPLSIIELRRQIWRFETADKSWRDGYQHTVRTWNAQLGADASRDKLYRGTWSPTMFRDIQIWT